MSDNIVTHQNPRGEIANYRGPSSMWLGDSREVDPTDEKLGALQPIDTVYPPCALDDEDKRVYEVAKAAVLGIVPAVKHNDDVERIVFSRTWTAARKLLTEFEKITPGPFFSDELGVFADWCFMCEKMGKAFVLQFTCRQIVGDCKEEYPFQTFSKGTKYHPTSSIRSALIGCVLVAGGYAGSMGHGAVEFVSSEDSDKSCRLGFGYGIHEPFGDAALMIALRRRTTWYKEWAKNCPF